MDQGLVKRLLAINREFYAEFALEFSNTRSCTRMDLTNFLPFLRDGLNVLDAGCGNGRLAERLDRERFSLKYTGIDLAPELIQVANALKPKLSQVSADFITLDVTAADWTRAVETRGPFDLAFALAVLHHIPGDELRVRVLSGIRSLLRPGGVLLTSNWQFLQNARLRRKQVPWQKLGIDEMEVERSDALIDWKRGGEGRRYVHQFTREELLSLAAESGLEVIDQFETDERLNLVSVLKRAK